MSLVKKLCLEVRYTTYNVITLYEKQWILIIDATSIKMKMIFFQMDRIIPSIFLVKVIGTCVYSVIVSSECLWGERQTERGRHSIPIIVSRNTFSRMG